MQWNDIRKFPIPEDKEVMVIWKGRIGIYFKDSTEDYASCAMCPESRTSSMVMDEESLRKIHFWMECPTAIFRCDIDKGEANGDS